ncbi:MAG: translation initiation factor 1 [Bacteroidia bacterium]|jgi:translation initiation factor 1
MAKKKKMNSLSDLGGMVFSTDPDYTPEAHFETEAESVDPSKQTLYVSYDKKQRKGKVVTLVQGFEGPESELLNLGKRLKSKCGAGGSVKENEIIVQGNFVAKIMEILTGDGYNVKKKGG